MQFDINAKINLFLAVDARRPDGFHKIRSIFHSVSLRDRLEVRLTGESVTIEVEGDAGPDEDNLASKAARAYLEAADELGVGVRIALKKAIPIGGGMGGGSADAAGVLLALDRLLGRLERSELMTLAADLGSDVPYCLQGGPALVEGRGESVTRLEVAARPLDVVVCISDGSLRTADVYGRWDRLGQPSHADPAEMIAAVGQADPQRVAAALHNDLEVAAFSLRPGLEEDKQALLDAGVLGALLSGSGPTLFGICADRDHATTVVEALRQRFHRVQAVVSRPTCVEPR